MLILQTQSPHLENHWLGDGLHSLGLNTHSATDRASQVALVVKNPPANAGGVRDGGSIPGSRRSPGGGHGNPLQCSSRENPMDRGPRWAVVHGVTKSRTWLKLSRAQLSSSSCGSVGSCLAPGPNVLIYKVNVIASSTSQSYDETDCK